MKNRIILMLSLVALSSCMKIEDGKVFFDTTVKEATGKLVDKEYVGNFDEIKVAQGIEAQLIKSDQEKIIVNAPSNIVDDVLVEFNGDKAYIHFKAGISFRGSHNVTVKVFVKDFSLLQASSGGSVYSNDKFTEEKLTIDVSSSGVVKGFYEANNLTLESSSSGTFDGKIWAINLDAKASSSGLIQAEGISKNATIKASSSGSFLGEKVVVQNAELRASSSGSISLMTEKELKAQASSSGTIRVKPVRGKIPSTQVTESSSGEVVIE